MSFLWSIPKSVGARYPGLSGRKHGDPVLAGLDNGYINSLMNMPLMFEQRELVTKLKNRDHLIGLKIWEFTTYGFNGFRSLAGRFRRFSRSVTIRITTGLTSTPLRIFSLETNSSGIPIYGLP